LPATLADGEFVATEHAVSIAAAGTFTAFWGIYDEEFESGDVFAAWTDSPCTAPAGEVLPATGATDQGMLFLSLALVALGAIVVIARRRVAA
jgi:LPXTG-motif cell wall-anchored protein